MTGVKVWQMFDKGHYPLYAAIFNGRYLTYHEEANDIKLGFTDDEQDALAFDHPDFAVVAVMDAIARDFIPELQGMVSGQFHIVQVQPMYRHSLN